MHSSLTATLRTAFVSIVLALICSIPTQAWQGQSGEGSKKVAGRESNPGEGEQQRGPQPRSDERDMSAIRDFRVSPPDLGNASSTISEVINLFPQSKRRRIHGSIYEFHRNDNLDARNFFDPVGEPLPEFKRNQFGFNVGGSLLGDRIHLLGSFDGLRINRGSTLLSRVPTAGQRGGDFSQLEIPLIDPATGQPFEDNRIPEQRINPISMKLLEFVPLPNQNDPDRNFINSRPRITNQDSWSIRGDYHINDSNKLLARYEYTTLDERRVQPIPFFDELQTNTRHDGEISYARTFSRQLLVEFELDVSRNVNEELSVNSGQEGLLASFGIPGIEARGPADEGVPDVRLTGYADFGDRNSPDSRVSNTYSPRIQATYAYGSHTFRFGVDYDVHRPGNNRTGTALRGRFFFDGDFTGDALADFLLGLPSSASRAVGTDRIDLKATYQRYFFRDQWRINSQFDLSFGLSYNYFEPFQSTIDNVSGFLPLDFEPSPDGEIVQAGSPRAIELGLADAGRRGLVIPDRNDWEPFVSLAYSPGANRRIVVRASYDIDYEPVSRFRFIRNLGRNFPFYFTETAQSSSEVPELDLSDPFAMAGSPEITVHGIEPRIRNAYFQNWKLVLQNEFIQRWNLEFEYEGTKGTGMLRTLPANVPLPGPGSIQPRRPNPEFGSFSIQSSGGSSIRHAFEVEMSRRLADGFAFSSEFTWSRTINDLFGRAANPRDLASERGPSGSPLVFSLNYIWDLPFGRDGWTGSHPLLRSLLGGWRLAGVTRIRKGEPFSVDVTGDPNNDGRGGDRPDLIGNANGDFQSTVDEWFDTSIFGPAAGGFGTAGRNIFYSPGVHVWDLAFSKQARLSDSDTLEFRIELFNAFNHVNFERPNTTFGTSLFGKIFGARRSREIEIALKYSF